MLLDKISVDEMRELKKRKKNCEGMNFLIYLFAKTDLNLDESIVGGNVRKIRRDES